MDQIEARRTARALTDAGIEAIATNRGGWSGGPASQVWGVKPFPADGLSGNYETRKQMPEWWQKVLEASDLLDLAAAAEARHRAQHADRPGSGVCERCAELSGETDFFAERYRGVLGG